MVVVGSRIEAVRWQLAIQKYIAQKGYSIGALVAFSGEVNDKESGAEPFSEHSKTLNPNLKGRDIREAFKGDRVSRSCWSPTSSRPGSTSRCSAACTSTGGWRASRPCRPSPGSIAPTPARTRPTSSTSSTSPSDVLASFKTYYETAQLESTTDPNLVLNLRAKLDGQGHYDDFEVDRVAKVELDPSSTQGDLLKAIEPVVDRLMKRFAIAKKAWTEAVDAGDEDEAKKHREDDGRPDPVPRRHGGLRAALHVPEPDLRLREHGPREAGDLLSAD